VSRRRLDAAIALLLAASAGWQAVASAGHPNARPWPAVALLAGAGVALATGRVVGSRLPVLLPVALALGVLVSLLAGRDALRGLATAGPLGYANADAALAVQGAAAGCLAVVSASGRRRLTAVVVVTALAVVTVLVRSAAADVGLVVVVAATLWCLVRPRRRVPAVVAAAAGVAVVCAVIATAAAGSAYDARATHGVDTVATHAVSARRVALWHDAVTLTARHPWRGVGPRRFPVESPTARRDADTRQAHSAYLQAGAETGVPGMALLVALLLALLARTAVASPPARAAVGAAALGAIALHASVDYVLQFPAVVVVAALVAGASSATDVTIGATRRRESPG
jgi:O-antigen ligase